MPVVPFSLGARTSVRSLAMAAAMLLAASALLGTGCGQQPTAEAPQTTQAVAIPKSDARLTLANNSGRYHFEGVVADEVTREALLRSLKSVYGGDAQGTIAIDPNTHPAPWAGALANLVSSSPSSGSAETSASRSSALRIQALPSGAPEASTTSRW